MSSSQKNKVSIIVALAEKTRAIGKDSDLLWRIPEDMSRFVNLTRGKTVIMGRKTWESIPERFRPLRDRHNIVITRNQNYEAEGANIANSLNEALRITREIKEQIKDSSEIFIIGGAQIYADALPITNTLYLTIVSDNPKGDVFFPEYKALFPNILFSEECRNNNLSWRYETRTK